MTRFVIAAVWITVAASARGAAHSTPLDTGAHYATVHGIRTYYYVTGTGTPLVRLHGAFSNIETDFGAIAASGTTRSPTMWPSCSRS